MSWHVVALVRLRRRFWRVAGDNAAAAAGRSIAQPITTSHAAGKKRVLADARKTIPKTSQHPDKAICKLTLQHGVKLFIELLDSR